MFGVLGDISERIYLHSCYVINIKVNITLIKMGGQNCMKISRILPKGIALIFRFEKIEAQKMRKLFQLSPWIIIMNFFFKNGYFKVKKCFYLCDINI